MPALTREEIRTYEEDGYVVPLLPASPRTAWRCWPPAAEEVMAANPGTRPEQLPNIHITNGAGTHLKGHPAFLDIALDEHLLDLVSCVIGDDIVMWGCQIFCKPGSDGMEVPMHQDGQYWPIRPLATCTVWLAIDDSDRENGCLAVVPGSHRDEVHFRHHTRTDDDIVLNQAVDDPRAFERPPAFVELGARAALHARHLSHPRLGPNSSGRRRAGLALRYIADHLVVPARPRDAVRGVSVELRGPAYLARPRAGRLRKERLHDRAHRLIGRSARLFARSGDAIHGGPDFFLSGWRDDRFVLSGGRATARTNSTT